MRDGESSLKAKTLLRVPLTSRVCLSRLCAALKGQGAKVYALQSS